MKNFERSILKAVIGVACTVFPVHKLHAQTIQVDKVTNDVFIGVGTSYTMPPQRNPYGVGSYINSGFASWVDVLQTKFNVGAIVLLKGGTAHFNNNTNRHNCGFGFKFGVGYDKVALMFIRESEISIGGKDDIIVMNANGCGVHFNVSPRTKINADYIYSLPAFNSKSQKIPSNITSQKHAVRVGLMYAFSHKENQK